MFERQSAIAQAMRAGGRDGADGRRQLRIGEERGWMLVQLAAFPATLAELERAVEPVLDANLPSKIGEVVTVGGRSLLRTGSAQFWIIAPEVDDLSPSLEAAVAPNIGAVTVLSHSRTCMVIEGSPSRDVLAKGIALDLHPDVFGVGQFALTGLHHTPILLHRCGELRYGVYAMRTFAQSVWEWLTDAALPFGYEIVHDF